MPFIWNVGPLFLGDSFRVIPSCIEGIISSRNGAIMRDLRLMVLGDLSEKTFIDRPMCVMTSVRCINGCMVVK